MFLVVYNSPIAEFPEFQVNLLPFVQILFLVQTSIKRAHMVLTVNGLITQQGSTGQLVLNYLISKFQRQWSLQLGSGSFTEWRVQ